MRETDASLKTFNCRQRQMHAFTFAGIEVITGPDGSFVLQQRTQIDHLKVLPATAEFLTFKSRTMQLSCVTHRSPKICCAVAQAAKVTAETLQAEDIKQFTSSIRLLLATPLNRLNSVRLDLTSLHMRVYTGSSFANNRDYTSQPGYIVTLADGSGRCNTVAYRSSKSRKAIRSVLGAELYAFSDGFDQAYGIRSDLEAMLQQKIPLKMFIDAKSLFNFMVRNSVTTERRLMIYV